MSTAPRAPSNPSDEDDATSFLDGLFRGRLIALLAFVLVWTSAQCVALCANAPSTAAGTASSEPPCHHRAPNSHTPMSCSSQQLPQADVPRSLLAPTSNTSLTAIDVAVVSFVQIPSLVASRAFPIPEVLRPPGIAVPPLVVLAIPIGLIALEGLHD